MIRNALHALIAGLFISLVVMVLSLIFATGACLYKSNGCTGVPTQFQDTPVSREYYK